VSTLATPNVRIDSYLEEGSLASMAADVRAGLGRSLKELPPKYFYDDRGSELFDRITEQPEYYPTRCERAILNRHAPALVTLAGARELVELGSGSASKTRALLYAMAGAGTLERYVPFDVSEAVVERSAVELTELYPGLRVHGLVGDFERHLERVPAGDRRLFAFLGGTIGNLYPDQRDAFLSGLRALFGPGDSLLLGTDLRKDPRVLEAAYNDRAGVTAEFNRNVLHNVNAALDGDFEPAAFEHRAFFDPQASWIEMRLRARAPQRVRIAVADLEVSFAEGEELRTEISTKFTPELLEQELAAAGLALEGLFTDEEGLFAVSLARPA
jgi:L-histidine N-alpha-methyltransferase